MKVSKKFLLSHSAHFQSSSSVDCDAPVAPQNGTLKNYTNTTEGSEVFYSCNPGLFPEGMMRAECTRNGWNPKPSSLSCTVGML